MTKALSKAKSTLVVLAFTDVYAPDGLPTRKLRPAASVAGGRPNYWLGPKASFQGCCCLGASGTVVRKNSYRYCRITAGQAGGTTTLRRAGVDYGHVVAGFPTMAGTSSGCGPSTQTVEGNTGARGSGAWAGAGVQRGCSAADCGIAADFGNQVETGAD